MKRFILVLLCSVLVAPLCVSEGETEITYDDGTAESSWTWVINYGAVRFTLPSEYLCNLVGARLYIINAVEPIPFEVVVFSSDGSTELGRVNVPGAPSGWFTVYFDSPIRVPYNFYIAISFTNSISYLGLDTDPPLHYRNYEGPPMTPFTPPPGLPDNNFMVRALVAPCPVGGEIIQANNIGGVCGLASSAVAIAAIAVAAAVLILKKE